MRPSRGKQWKRFHKKTAGGFNFAEAVRVVQPELAEHLLADYTPLNAGGARRERSLGFSITGGVR